MVRTSDFQFENVGSIPSSPIIMKLNSINKLFLLTNNDKASNKDKLIIFSFYFSSLISPFILKNLKFSSLSQTNEKRILIKQSYVLLSWFYYLTFVQQKLNTKNKLKFFVAPTNRKIFTLTKAPIAHKNWSKEQYKFQFYKFKISFSVYLKEGNNLNSLNKAILFILITKKNFPQFETNLLFLKNISFNYNFNDFNYFNYFNYSNRYIK